MKKLQIILLIFIMFISITPVNAQEDNSEEITSNYLYAYDLESNEVVYDKNADEKMYPASMTKIVTVMVAINKIEASPDIDFDDTVVIEERDLDTIFETGASAAFFQIGETVTYNDLLYGAMLPSGADACRALGFNLFGDQEAFVQAMNDYVQNDLGLKDTNFMNATGIHDDNHYTTARQMGEITRIAIENEKFYEIFTTYSYTSSNDLHDWANLALLYGTWQDLDISNIIGCKSGFTDEAQSCLASLVEIDGRLTITVTAKTDSELQSPALRDTLALMELVDEKYDYIKVIEEGTQLVEIPVLYAKNIKRYKLEAPEDVVLYLPVGTTIDDLDVEFNIEDIIPDIKIGDKLGNYTLSFNDKVMYEKEIISDMDIEKETLPYIQYLIFDKYLPYTIAVCLTVVYIALYFYKPKKKNNP